MSAILILSLALFSGAASALELNQVTVPLNGTANSTLLLEQFPTIVQVDFLDTAASWWSWRQKCAGTVLNELYVLSSASCFTGPGYRPDYRRIRAGSNFRNAGGIISYVQWELNYDSQNATNGSLINDISVVRLVTRLFFTNLIRPSPILQQGSVVPRGAIVSQLGWGDLGNNNMTALNGNLLTLIGFTGANNTQLANALSALPVNAGTNYTSHIDVGGPWIWANITIGVIPSQVTSFNGTNLLLLATSVSDYTNWIISVAR